MMPTRKLDTFSVNTNSTSRSFQILEKWEEYHIRQMENGGNQEIRDKWKYKFINCDNLHLAFHRWFPQSSTEGDKKEDKKKFLDSICTLASSLGSSGLQGCSKRLRYLFESYKLQGWGTVCLAKDGLPTQWRLVIGLGNESVLETSITLHHLYGFPYIPSTAVKGIARALALYEEGRACEEEDLRLNVVANAKIDNDARNIFGCQNQIGKVVFFDAFPTEFPKLDVDVINVHYQDYYSSGQPPGDWMSPVPSFFLTVAPGEKFNFYLASRDASLLNKAADWLKAGLTQLGVGAKTSAGYGYFKPESLV